MRRAIFPGTFDPFTIGHYSVVKRALTFMDEVVIGIGINENKKTWFPTEKRVEMIEKLFADDPRVKVDAYDCLTIDFARAKEAQFIVRGIRTVHDFEYEERGFKACRWYDNEYDCQHEQRGKAHQHGYISPYLRNAEL